MKLLHHQQYLYWLQSSTVHWFDLPVDGLLKSIVGNSPCISATAEGDPYWNAAALQSPEEGCSTWWRDWMNDQTLVAQKNYTCPSSSLLYPLSLPFFLSAVSCGLLSFKKFYNNNQDSDIRRKKKESKKCADRMFWPVTPGLICTPSWMLYINVLGQSWSTLIEVNLLQFPLSTPWFTTQQT